VFACFFYKVYKEKNKKWSNKYMLEKNKKKIIIYRDFLDFLRKHANTPEK